MFNMTAGEAKAILNENNIFPFTSNPTVEGKNLEQYKRVLARKARTSIPVPVLTPEQNQKEMLNQDFVIFTHMALCKPITSKILRQAVQYKLMDNTRTQIVICSGTIRDVQDFAKDFAKIGGFGKSTGSAETAQDVDHPAESDLG